MLLVVVRLRLAQERRESGVVYDFTSAQTRADPYPAYRRLRELDPAHRTRLVDAWVLSRHRDVEAVLRDHRRFSNVNRILVQTIPLSLLDMDPPEHTRPRDDLVSGLLAAEEAGDRLTHEELLSVMLLVLVAGNETTRSLIGNIIAWTRRSP